MHPPAPPAIRRRSGLPRDVYVLALIAFLVAVGFGVMVPVLPVFARSFNVSGFMVGAVISAFALMRLVTAPVCGRLNAWIGERTALGIGMFIVATSTALAGLSGGFWQLLVMRGLGGVGSAMFTVAATTLLLRAVDATHRGRATALYSSGFLLGNMAGPAVGGVVATISVTAPFFFYSVTLVLAGGAALTLLSRSQDSGGGARSTQGSVVTLRLLARDVRYQSACLMNFTQGWQSHGVRNSLVPLLVTEVMHGQPSWTGWAFAVAAVTQGLALGPIGRAVDTVGRRPLLLTGGLICALGAAGIAFAPNIWVLTGLLACYGVGASMATNASTAIVGDVAGARSGMPIAVFQMTSDLGSIVGPLAAGLIADSLGIGSAFVVGAALIGSAALQALRMPETLPTCTQENPQ